MEYAHSAGAHSAGRAHKAGTRTGTARTLAQVTAGLLGVALVAAGILGFIYGDSSFGVGGNLAGEELYGFEVNGWHNVVHIATGAFLLLMLPSVKSAIAGLMVFGLLYAAVTVWGFVTDADLAGVVPVNTADNVLHAVLAGLALIVGFATAGLQAGARRALKE